MGIDWSGQNVVIIGAARQGIALARYLADKGAHVTLNDRKPMEEISSAQETLQDLVASGALELVFGDHPLTLLDGADMVCPSGGVPLTLPLVVEAQRRGIKISNNSMIFMELVPCMVIGITGSAGKTTTTTLVGLIAKAAVEGEMSGSGGQRVWVGGNIGLPLITYVDQMKPGDLVVMELSSFQLEIMNSSPDVAAILNITPNHLDRHASMQAYTAAKRRILDYQTQDDSAILGRDDPGAWSMTQDVKGYLYSFGFNKMPDDGAGMYLAEDCLYLRRHNREAVHVMEREQVTLRGDHNLLNVMAACTIAAAAGLPVEAMRIGVKSFHGIPHRLDYVRTWGGADWYNNSIATAPERSIAAILSFDEPLVLLAGGKDKDLPWDELANLICQRVDHLVLFGDAVGIIEKALSSVEHCPTTITRCDGLKEAVEAAAGIVEPGDVVLLSPGGTSYDEFFDFEERGECFEQWVNELP